MDTLCCPECGHTTFEQTRTTRTEYTLEFSPRSGWFETSETVVDGGDMGDHDIVCADCRYVVDDESTLITVEQFDADYC